MIVLDASVLANVIGDDGPDGRRARREVRAAGDLAAPDLVDPETVAVRASAGWPGRSLTTGSRRPSGIWRTWTWIVIRRCGLCGGPGSCGRM